jgi:hypothetical protein
MPALHAVHESDPKKALLKKVGNLKEFELLGNAILLAIYLRPDKAITKSGVIIHLPDKVQDEDKYQGKVGLVLKKGPQAFVDDENVQFHGQNVDVGDWVVIRPSDGWSLTLTQNQVLCRMVTESAIRMKIPSPDAVW